MFCSKCGASITPGTAFCQNCGAPVASAAPPPSYPTAASPQYAPPNQVPPVAVATYSAPAPQVAYAGFWLRLVAVIIDGLILAIPVGLLFFALFADILPRLAHNEDPFTFVQTFLPRVFALVIAYFIASWLYWAGTEGSSWQGTLGKKALGLYVTDLNGVRATFGRTSGRFWGGRGLGFIPYLGGLYFIVSCICAGFTARKQAIHDMIAGTLVLRKL